MKKQALFKAIELTEAIFKEIFTADLNLQLIKGPLLVDPTTGLNDNLSGIEKPLSFSTGNEVREVVQSLAKWKRQALAEYEFKPLTGLYVNMHAIRPDENDIDKYHDFHVDQYDWEKHITKDQYNIEFLKQEVAKIYQVIVQTKVQLTKKLTFLTQTLAPKITFITSEELYQLYPTLSPEKREKAFTKKHRSVFIIGIGKKLSNNEKHDLRAFDYDNWSLNGDLLVWDKLNQDALELSSMGIRVDAQVMQKQYLAAEHTFSLATSYHQKILKSQLPLSIGGGIGRSRLNMFLLEQDHILKVK